MRECGISETWPPTAVLVTLTETTGPHPPATTCQTTGTGTTPPPGTPTDPPLAQMTTGAETTAAVPALGGSHPPLIPQGNSMFCLSFI